MKKAFCSQILWMVVNKNLIMKYKNSFKELNNTKKKTN